jgi:2-C-methyl-D-erythritol 4-phosphate cytidylyltransferase
VIVAPLGWEEPAILLAEELGCTKASSCVAGGATRAESVRAGVGEVSRNAAVVLVHDAARPLLPEEVIERVLAPLAEGGDGVIPALPLADTIKRVRGDEVAETLDRSELVAAQTPQAFGADMLRTALGGDVADASDCAALVEAAGGRVKVVPGDPRLLKVTTPEDLELVQSWLG